MEGLTALLTTALQAFGEVLMVYFLVVNTSYLVLIVLAAVEFARFLRRQPFTGHDETYASPTTPPISVLVPAYNEEVSIVDAVHAMLALRYPTFEVVVVDDGSSDRTVERLAEAFDLVRTVRMIPAEVPTRSTVLATYAARSGTSALTVVQTTNAGRAAAINTAINVARYPLLCMVDADSLLDPDALLAVAKPFTDDPLRVVATGGVVRVVNGCAVLAGRIVDVRTPGRWLPRIQVAEYLRAFLLGRTGWSRMGGLLIISGAFGLFRRDALVRVGGLDMDTIGEDAELVVRLHRRLRRAGRDYRIVFVPEPVSWTEVPESTAVLGRQRRRWHRGLTEILIRHRAMIGNPRYGRIGVLALPYYLLFEALAPVIELVGLVVIPLALALGVLEPAFVLQLLLVTYGYAMVVTLAAVAVEEFSFRRYTRWRDLGVIVLATLVENLGYRQLTVWWRVHGLWQTLRGTRPDWGVMTRTGFTTIAPPSRPAKGPT